VHEEAFDGEEKRRNLLLSEEVAAFAKN